MRTSRSGFSLIELMIALALLGIVVAKLTIVIDEARTSHGHQSASMAIEDRALYVLDKIAYAILGSDRDTLFPDNAMPTFTDRLNYKVSLGVEDGVVVWGEPEVIALSADGTSVYWAENEGEVEERLITWANNVSELLENEILNNGDDNANGLSDESGLNFVLDGDSVTIRLTLRGEDSDGRVINHTVETVVTCRN